MKRYVVCIVILIIVIALLCALIFRMGLRKERMDEIGNSTSTIPENMAQQAQKISIKSKLMKISSPSFEDKGTISSKFTCDGENINPELRISDIPSEAKSLTLIVDDPDAPGGTFVHWLVWNMPPDTETIFENSVVAGAIQGTTSFGSSGYGGPCPPSGTHRYFFKLYALDVSLSLGVSANKEDLEKAMKGHILDQAELMGTYQRMK